MISGGTEAMAVVAAVAFVAFVGACVVGLAIWRDDTEATRELDRRIKAAMRRAGDRS